MNQELTNDMIENLRQRLSLIAQQPGFGTDFVVGVGIVINPTQDGRIAKAIGQPAQLAEIVIDGKGRAIKNRWGKSCHDETRRLIEEELPDLVDRHHERTKERSRFGGFGLFRRKSKGS